MVTEEGLKYLQERFGEHDYNYPNLSDKNVWSVIQNHDCKTFEELDKHCTHLNRIVGEINEMKGKMHE